MKKAFPLEWRLTSGLTNYEEALAEMESRVASIRAGTSSELIWLLEHPPLYTAGTSASENEILSPLRFPLYKSGRGGRYTYHGPGQRIIYLVLDLKKRGQDIRAYISALETWGKNALAQLGVTASSRPNRVGLWIQRTETIDDKVAAIGVRVRQWITFHGMAINVAPNLDHYQAIMPCGIVEHGVTSLAKLGITSDTAKLDRALAVTFAKAFDPSNHINVKGCLK